jgi:hypothetical protein
MFAEICFIVTLIFCLIGLIILIILKLKQPGRKETIKNNDILQYALISVTLLLVIATFFSLQTNQEQLKLNRESFLQKNRPYLYIDKIEKSEEPTNSSIKIYFKNSGNLPAEFIISNLKIRFGEFNKDIDLPKTKQIIFQGNEGYCSVLEFNRSQWEKVIQNQELFIEIDVDYWSIYESPDTKYQYSEKVSFPHISFYNLGDREIHKIEAN